MELGLSSQIIPNKKKLESFVLKNTNDIIESSWISTKIVRGKIKQSLDNFINDQKIDLIITRQTIFKRFSTYRNDIFKQILLNISDLPTLLIPENNSYEPICKFAYLTDFKQDDFINIKWLKNSFPNSLIEVLHFSRNFKETPEQNRWIKYLNNEISDTNIKFRHKDLTIDEFVEQESSNTQPDYNCLVLTTHKRNFWQKMTDPSTTLGFLNEVETPTLVFKYTSNKLNIVK
ncbi:hypothetical protein A8C32_13655 [Flavivirga aquatica]|uniref:UspA domain-containing protein n=1 Tax=Flavivirga aquatica TaxID=1849968 RepID=A0A1E5TC66_9FLAO|nr:hypothetical protein [Flavivirga aquatica]OEK08950.1 hypothetical protein A8C32_13655 [Flavivirga aquatica]